MQYSASFFDWSDMKYASPIISFQKYMRRWVVHPILATNKKTMVHKQWIVDATKGHKVKNKKKLRRKTIIFYMASLL